MARVLNIKSEFNLLISTTEREGLVGAYGVSMKDLAVFQCMKIMKVNARLGFVWGLCIV